MAFFSLLTRSFRARGWAPALLVALALASLPCVAEPEEPAPAAEAAAAVAADATGWNHEPSTGDRTICRVVVAWTLQKHYNQPELNDEISQSIFDEFFGRLDPERAYFLASDLEEYAPYRLILDDLLRNGDLDFAFAVYRRFLQRVSERIDYVRAHIDDPFDYTQQEELLIDRKDAPWAADQAALDELWRKRLKNQRLGMMLDDERPYAAKDGEDPAKKIVERYEDYLEALLANDNSDLLELFLTSFTQVFDPYSSYFNWRTSEDFDISMKLSLQGIGATLTAEDGYTKVVSIVPGGPAALDGRLKPGDHILAVAQADGEPQDVVNMPLNQVVRLIRGEKGTTVTLTITKDVHDAATQTIAIVRDEVKLTDQEAKGEPIDFTGPDGQAHKLGIVFLPSFYADFEALRRGDPEAKSTTVDVRRIIDEMIANAHIEGLVIDLRYNGGGSLTEAINLAGLFIPSGPVVQVRERDTISVHADTDGGFAYNLPLIVLTNRASASASEIFAAAIQDYGRGLVIGDASTHGKGTVQTVRQLDVLRSLSRYKPGALKYTMAKFYRVNGGSTQRRGVRPDLVLPSFLDHLIQGEEELEHALAWDEIEPQKVRRADPDVAGFLPVIRERHEQRLGASAEFKELVEDIYQFGKRRERKTLTLNRDERIELRKEDKFWAERSDNVLSQTKQGKLTHVADAYNPDADFYMHETLNVLSDLVDLTGGRELTVARAPEGAVAPVTQGTVKE